VTENSASTGRCGAGRLSDVPHRAGTGANQRSKAHPGTLENITNY